MILYTAQQARQALDTGRRTRELALASDLRDAPKERLSLLEDVLQTIKRNAEDNQAVIRFDLGRVSGPHLGTNSRETHAWLVRTLVLMGYKVHADYSMLATTMEVQIP